MLLLEFTLDNLDLFVLVQIEGNNAKADDAIMLDKDGFVSETNATNIVSHVCTQFSHARPIHMQVLGFN